MTLKKTLAILLAAALMCLTFAGCSRKPPKPQIENMGITEIGLTEYNSEYLPYYWFFENGDFGSYIVSKSPFGYWEPDELGKTGKPEYYEKIGTWKYISDKHNEIELHLTGYSETFIMEISKDGISESNDYDDFFWTFKNRNTGKEYRTSFRITTNK